jgi:2,3-bisphosphoglycerate-dependent phosphoglycerate mutase
MKQPTRLIIARHGNTFAPGDVVTRVGTTDLPLVASGLVQGQKMGAYLKQNNLIPTCIFTSKLKRAMQTAEEAQKAMQTHLPIETLSIFNEIDYGPDENKPEAQVEARVGKEALAAWETEATVPAGWRVDPDEIIKNWQTFAANLTRTHAGQTILVVTSNGIARFSPYLTGDFRAFARQHHIKISTGALCLFEQAPASLVWHCMNWNIRP